MIENAPKTPKNDESLDEVMEANRSGEGPSHWVKIAPVRDLLERAMKMPPTIAFFEGFAKSVKDDELCREPGNGGRPLDPIYIENNEKARDFFVNAIVDDSLYRSPEEFSNYLKKAHALAAAHDVYGMVGENMGLRTEDIGAFRPPNERLNVGGNRREIAKQVAGIAKKYNDPYGERFTERRVGAKYIPSIMGMTHLPKDGLTHDIAAGPEGVYLLDYPDAKYIPNYMAQMAKIGKQIEQELRAEQPDTEKAVRLIGQQYSYGAIIRPFAQINNSLFMNLANAQLKLFGMDGMTHGILDHAAQRMQTNNFAEYFADRAFGRIRP